MQYLVGNFMLLNILSKRHLKMNMPYDFLPFRYHLCNSEDLIQGKVIEIRALNRVFALWRTKDGNPVAQVVRHKFDSIGF